MSYDTDKPIILRHLKYLAQRVTSKLSVVENSLLTLNSRTNVLTAPNHAYHNSIAGFRNKGTVVTDEQKTAITSQTYDDLYIGDNWTINGHKYFIAKFARIYSDSGAGNGIMMISSVLYDAQMNETNTNEGGYYNSWMYSAGLEQAGEILATDWGDLLANFKEYIPNTNESGFLKSTAQTMPFKCMLPTHMMLYGKPYTPYPQEYYSYHSNKQLPVTLFEGYNTITQGGSNYWLQECFNDTTGFICFNSAGIDAKSTSLFPASKTHGVRVVFFIR